MSLITVFGAHCVTDPNGTIIFESEYEWKARMYFKLTAELVVWC